MLIDWIRIDNGEIDARAGDVLAGSMEPIAEPVDRDGFDRRLTGWTWRPTAHCSIPPAEVARDFRAWLAALPITTGEAVDLDEWGDGPPLARVRFEAVAGNPGAGRVEFREAIAGPGAGPPGPGRGDRRPP